MKTTFLAIATLSLLGLFTACGPAADSSRDHSTIERLVVALEPDKDPDAMLADRKALKAYLSNALDMPVEVIVPLTSSVISEGLKNNSIDLAYLSSTATQRLMASNDMEILLANAIDGKASYLSYWLSLADKPYDSVEDLEGERIAFSSRTSTSGFLIPVWDLYTKGLVTLEDGPEGFFGAGNVHYGVGYVSAVERVLDGSAEAAAVSYYVYEKDKHLTPDQRQRLKVVDDQGPVPTHVLTIRGNLNNALKDRVRKAFLEMNEKAADLRDRLFGAPLVEVDPEVHLEVTRQALETIEKMRL